MRLFTPNEMNHQDLPKGFIHRSTPQHAPSPSPTPNVSDDFIIILLIILLLFNEPLDDAFNYFMK